MNSLIKGFLASMLLLLFLPVLHAADKKGAAYRDRTTGMEFVYVKGGCYQMGDTFGDGNSDERPAHQVCAADFYIGEYDVTQLQWQKVMGNNPSHFKNCGDNCPVEN